jgi:hypothetical protein
MRLAPLLFFTFDRAADDAQFVFDNKRLPTKLADQERQQVIDYLKRALEQESGAQRDAKVSRGLAVSKFDTSVEQVVKGAYPPAWARMALVQEYQGSHPFQSGDSTDRAFRDLGISVRENVEVMEADLMPKWIEIIQSAGSQR